MRPWLCLLILSSVFAINQSQRQNFLNIEEAVPNNDDTLGYICSESKLDYVKYVCSYCNGTYAYRVSKQTATNVDPLTPEEHEQLQEVIDDFQAYLQSAEYVAVASGNDTCVAAYNIRDDVDVHSMYENFTGKAYPNVSSIELFDLTEDELTLRYIGAKYDGADYSNYTVKADANETGTAGCCTTFHCTSVTLKETDGASDVIYSGTVYYTTENGTYSTGFNISSSEYREEGDTYTVSIEIGGKYTYKEWNDMIDYQANCSGVERPVNMSSLDNLPITHVDLFMETIDGASTITLVESYFDSLSFSGGYGFYLFSNEGMAVIRTENHTCYNAFVGNWTLGNFTYSATYLNKDTGYYFADARLMDRGNMTIREIQDNLVSYLFLDPNLILPEYEATQSKTAEVLWATVIVDPYVKILYETGVDTQLKVSGEGDLATVDSQIEVRVARVEGVVTGLSSFFQVEEAVYLEEDPAFERTDQSVLVASNPVDFTAYPFMQPTEAANYTYVDAGYWYEVTLFMTENCTNSDFCLLVQNGLETKTDSLILRGSEESDTTFLATELSTIVLKSGLKFKEDAFVYDFSSSQIFILGASTLRGDSVEVLRFIGNITDVDTKSYFKVVTEKLWYSAFDIEQLTVTGLTIKGNLTADLEISDSSARGQVLMGTDCDVQDCPAGEIQVWLNGSDYTNNQFRARFENYTAMTFFNAFSDYNFTSSEEVPYQLSTVDPTNGFTLDYAYPTNTVTDLKGFLIQGNITYFGVPSALNSSASSLSSDHIDLSFEMSDFTAGSGNIKVLNGSGFLSTDSDAYYTTEYITGTVVFADLTATTNLTVSETGISCSLEGKVYGGLYEAEVVFTAGNETSIETATFSGEFYIDDSELDDLEDAVRRELNEWIQTGLKALNQSKGWVKDAMEPVKELEPFLCVENVACGKRQECSRTSYVTCKQYTVKPECVSEGNACKSVSLTCSESETICSVTKADCEGEDCCETSVTVCHEWSESCTDATNDNCKYFELDYDLESCDRMELSCSLEDIEEQACLQKCKRTQYMHERAIENYNNEQDGYHQSQVDLQGFRSMQDIIHRDFETSSLIEFIRIKATRTLDEAGIGPNDWTYVLEGKALSLLTEKLEDFSVTLTWDLFDDEVNERSLLKASKSAIVRLSDGELSEELGSVSPFELIEGNRVSAKS
mmetsp:Transcript_8398/g.16722  ORF Transcript_8398/g.16722 Transcript_8398/m.16722 type:complete len:1180 (+) Transcript_8398:4214-7753(+)